MAEGDWNRTLQLCKEPDFAFQFIPLLLFVFYILWGILRTNPFKSNPANDPNSRDYLFLHFKKKEAMAESFDFSKSRFLLTQNLLWRLT